MAIYHFNIAIHSRAAGHSAVAGSAYRTGEKLIDSRTGIIHDFTKKNGVDYTEIITPQGIETPDRQTYWNAVEHKNKRHDAQICRDIKIALPHELNEEERKAATREIAQYIADKYSIGVDVAIHQPHRKGDGRNVHAHLLISTNKLEAIQGEQIQFGTKVREFDDIAVKKSNGQLEQALSHCREKWTDICNKHLELSGSHVRIDHRSYEAQGIDKVPTIHMGKAATAMERRGEESDRGNINREIRDFNKQIEITQKGIEQSNIELVQAQKAIENLTEELAALNQEKDITPEKKQDEREPDQGDKFGLSDSATYQDAQAAFNTRMGRENSQWAEDEKNLSEVRQMVGATGYQEKEFSAFASHQLKRLTALRQDAVSLAEQVKKLQAERDKATGIFAGGKRKELDAKIVSLSELYNAKAEQWNNRADEAAKIERALATHAKHTQAFEQSPEKEHWFKEIHPKQAEKEWQERQRKREQAQERLEQQRGTKNRGGFDR